MIKRSIILIGLVALVLFNLMFGSIVQAATQNSSISVSPSSVEVSHGDTFTIKIKVEPGGAEIYGAQYYLYFNPTLLKATSQSQGTFLSQNGATTAVIRNEINNSVGKIEYGESRMGAEHGVTNPGVLASITFEVIGTSGTSELKLSDVILSDPEGDPVETTINSGTVVVKGEQPPSPFLISGYVICSDGKPVFNPDVTITNLNTTEVFIAETNVSSNYYQVSTDSEHVSTGNILHFHVASNGSTTKFNHTVTKEEINNGGFEQNITIPAPEPVIDTRPGGYPSIMGTHNGTIIPDRTITVRKLYTYFCPGTGGHTEYIKIWNETINEYAEAHWNGYIEEDYHNISFNEPLTLKKGVIYNYTIRTGSYPQIIHAKEYPAIGGVIKCEEFIDVNGKRYTDWIPAIRLYQ